MRIEKVFHGAARQAQRQFLEASYFVMDSHDNIWTGDTARGRITEMIAPQNQNKNQKMRAAGQKSDGRPRT